MTAAHDQMLTLHIRQHIEDHAPREQDPNYHLFEAAKARLKKAGLWKCIIGDELCDGGPELHHSVIEFSEANAVDPDKVGRALGLHFESDAQFQEWIEGPSNLEVLCVAHHRAGYGIHQLPEPLWQAVRFKRGDVQAPAIFIPAKDLPTPGGAA